MKIKLFANLRHIAGHSEIQMDLAEEVTLGEVMTNLSDQYGNEMKKFLFQEHDKISDIVMILVNGKQIDKNQSVYLSNQDEISLLLPIGGG